jgi:hypothetical protein
MIALDEFHDSTEALLGDVARCHDALKPLVTDYPDPTPEQRKEGQFWIRMFNRAFFALVEGVAYTMRHLAIQLHESGQLPLSPGELYVLLQKRYRFDKGKISEADAFNSAIDNIHIAFSLFPKAFDVDFSLDTKDQRYVSFRQAIKIRDAITHPKSPRDLELSSEAISQIGDAGKWFSSEGLRMQKLCYESVAPEVRAEWLQIKVHNQALKRAPNGTA